MENLFKSTLSGKVYLHFISEFDYKQRISETKDISVAIEQAAHRVSRYGGYKCYSSTTIEGVLKLLQNEIDKMNDQSFKKDMNFRIAIVEISSDDFINMFANSTEISDIVKNNLKYFIDYEYDVTSCKFEKCSRYISEDIKNSI